MPNLATPPTQKGSLFNALHALADNVDTMTKAAGVKRSDAPTPKDPGGYQGPSTHPTTDVDNRGQDASEGARSSENVADVNADQGEIGVNKAKDAKPGQQDDVQLNIGTQQSATGEDPSVEDDYKPGKEDPGTAHPAATDNDSLDGHKYAAASFSDLHRIHTELSNSILADICNGHDRNLTKAALDKAAANVNGLNPSAAGDNPPQQPRTQAQGAAPPGQPTTGTTKAGEATQQPTAGSLEELIKQAAAAVHAGRTAPDAAATQNPDLSAGYDLASHLGLEKEAAQTFVAECIQHTIKEACEDADLFGSYIQKWIKRAMADEAGGSEDHDHDGDDTSGANPAEGTGGESGGGGGSDEGGDGGGGGGGGSLGDMLGGSDPGGLMGGGGDMGGGGGGAGGVSEEEALMQLISALQELGIPIEALAGAGGGGGMGGPPPGDMGGGGMGGPPPGDMGGPPPGGMGGPPPGMGGDMGGGAGGPPPMGEGMKLASAATAFMRKGRYEFKTANAGTRERQIRDEMKAYLREVMGQ